MKNLFAPCLVRESYGQFCWPCFFIRALLAMAMLLTAYAIFDMV